MSEVILQLIENSDLKFENRIVKIVAVKTCPEIELAGLKLGPFNEGDEYTVRYWVAEELAKAGIAKLHGDEPMNLIALHKVQWREMIQTARRLSSISKHFYPKLRRYLADLKAKMVSNPSYAEEYSKAVRVAHDIVECRLRKIVGLASAPAKTSIALENLTGEEKFLYELLHSIISTWRSKILGVGGSNVV